MTGKDKEMGEGEWEWEREQGKERERGKGTEGGEREYTSLFVPFSYREGNAETTSQVRRILQPARVL